MSSNNSDTKTVNNHKSLCVKSLKPDDIPRFIGKGGSGMKKNVIFPSWAMYDEHVKNKGIEEEKPKLFVGIENSDDSVTATIKTESPIMMKFAEHNLKKYVEKVSKSKGKAMNTSVHTLLAVCPHAKTPMLIGKRGSAINTMKAEASESFDDEKKSHGDRSWIEINPCDYDSISELCLKVRKDDNMSFIGWEPEESDTDEYISIKISNRLKDDDFETFVDEFKTIINAKISSIVDYQSRMMSDIDEALVSDDDEW